jgi:transcription termination/antitermination protein NusA
MSAIDSDGTERVKAVFARHVPEVSSGIVEIKAVAWEQNEAVLVAVHSEDVSTDPVGVCCRPSRMQRIARDFGRERFTLILWSRSLEEFVANSIVVSARSLNLRRKTPRVEVSPKGDEATVFVDARTLIDLEGGRCLRLRLASRLVGVRLTLLRDDE